MSIAILFADRDSIYKQFPECDVYDVDRDARTYPGGLPVVAHPPCRLWGCLSHLSTAPPEEKDLARFAVQAILQDGGILEHPCGSKLWADQGLPKPGEWQGPGYTISVNQSWWGHRATKKTWLWIYGLAWKDLPAHPLSLHCPSHVVSSILNRTGSTRKRPEISKKERNATPPDFAKWLMDVARLCRVNYHQEQGK